MEPVGTICYRRDSGATTIVFSENTPAEMWESLRGPVEGLDRPTSKVQKCTPGATEFPRESLRSQDSSCGPAVRIPRKSLVTHVRRHLSRALVTGVFVELLGGVGQKAACSRDQEERR